MNALKLENMELDNITYYTLITFPKIGNGKIYKTAYKTLNNAKKQAEKLIKDIAINEIVIRKNEVVKRRYNCEYSVSSYVYKIEK